MTPQQELFGAVCELLGWDFNALTPTAKTRIGKVVKELREAGATREQVLFARDAWDRMWGGRDDTPTLTDTALMAWWPEIAKRWEARQRALEARARAQQEEQRLEEDALPREQNRAHWHQMMSTLGVTSATLLKDIEA